MNSSDYWEARAQRFASEADALRAVCSFGMPGFYNHAIDWCQRRALRPYIDGVAPGTRVLDFGCGVGRWSREFARRGARVRGIDLSPTMVAEAHRRAAAAGLAERCEFLCQDVAALEETADTGRYDVILGVTVLQHLPENALERTLHGLAARLAHHGRLILLEAAPTRQDDRCDTATFRARPVKEYLRALTRAGLVVREVTGVDPSPLKIWLLPHYRSLPRPVALAALALVTLISVPIDIAFAGPLTHWSWHKVMVAERNGGPP
jgi:2-polyprenyl-3-methyl-5-hydroxy-6-metoxy-1,4-benzoquinol methylase